MQTLEIAYRLNAIYVVLTTGLGTAAASTLNRPIARLQSRLPLQTAHDSPQSNGWSLARSKDASRQIIEVSEPTE
jgi:hypothetical protein